MRIVHLIAGAGPMYCGSCMHGNTLAAGLRKAGADVILAPLYTPLRTDEVNLSIGHLALGGINVYLDDALPWWRRMPAALRRLLNRPSLVAWAASRGGSTRPGQLGSLTVAMFRGDDGPLKEQVQQLLDWLQADLRPDIVHLSNVMLAGLARSIKERLGVPVVATLTGEDSFLERLPRPYYEQSRAELRARAADLDAIIALSRDYADFMSDYLAVPRTKIEVTRPGLNLEGFPRPALPLREGRGVLGPLLPSGEGRGVLGPPLPSGEGRGEGNSEQSPTASLPIAKPVRTIGFFSRICADKGLHLLLEAMRALNDMPELPPCRLRAAGYLDRSDRNYLKDLERQAKSLGIADRFEYVGELHRSGKIAFLKSLDVFCLPSLLRESKGLPVLEAWACGAPAVLPNRGVLPELVADTGGGLLYDPGRSGDLAATLARMVADPTKAVDYGRAAQCAVHDRYTVERESRDVLSLYARLVAAASS